MRRKTSQRLSDCEMSRDHSMTATNMSNIIIKAESDEHSSGSSVGVSLTGKNCGHIFPSIDQPGTNKQSCELKDCHV